MRSLLPAALPLRAGYRVVVPGVVQSDGDPDRIAYRVTGRERIRAGSLGMVDCWVVETPIPGGGDLRFWISDKAPHLIRMTLTGVPAPVGGQRYDQSFDMIDYQAQAAAR
jgi:hypothetical protein